MKRCSVSVMDSLCPTFSQDFDGVSNFVYQYKKIVEPRINRIYTNDLNVQKLVDDIKRSGKGKQYDCILGLSGGLDSSYMLHKAVVEYGLRPLVFHVDCGWNTAQAVSNIKALVSKLGLELQTFVPPWDIIADFQLALFKAGIPHLDIPQDNAFVSVLYKIARQTKINYILNGGNIFTEAIPMPYQYYYWGTDPVHVRGIYGRFGTGDFSRYPFASVFYTKIVFPILTGGRLVKLLNFSPFNYLGAQQELKDRYGWQGFAQKHFESRFTRYLEGRFLVERFDLDVRKYQYSSLILCGQLSRDVALKYLDRPVLTETDVYVEENFIADKLNISLDEFHALKQLPRRYYWDYPNLSFVLKALGNFAELIGFARRGASF